MTLQSLLICEILFAAGTMSGRRLLGRLQLSQSLLPDGSRMPARALLQGLEARSTPIDVTLQLVVRAPSGIRWSLMSTLSNTRPPLLHGGLLVPPRTGKNIHLNHCWAMSCCLHRPHSPLFF